MFMRYFKFSERSLWLANPSRVMGLSVRVAMMHSKPSRGWRTRVAVRVFAFALQREEFGEFFERPLSGALWTIAACALNNRSRCRPNSNSG
jgi:hypothetical protein